MKKVSRETDCVKNGADGLKRQDFGDLDGILEATGIPTAYKIGYVLNHYREPSFRSIETTFGLTRPEIVMLIFLVRCDGITAAEICQFSGHLKPNMSRAAIALERKGLIRRVADAQDQRRQLLFVTAEGRRMHDRFMPLLAERESTMLACLSERERAQLTRLLRKLAAHVPDWAGG